MPPTKRPAESDTSSGAGPSKVQKLAPIFQKPDASSPAAFRWLTSGKATSTLLRGVHLEPPCTTRVAAFDLDGTLIKSTFGKGASKDAKGKGPLWWEWWRRDVPSKLKELAGEGYSIVIISNQGLKSAKLAEWKKKIPLIAGAVPDVPFRIYAATAKDTYRKPMPGMWYELERTFREAGIEIDKAASFFVGDAAGRADDFAGTDRKWALNADVPFFTPEEYFLKLPPAPYTLSGFNVASLPAVPPASPTSPANAPLPPVTLTTPGSLSTKPSLVLFVGPPGSGKSAYFRRHFAPAGFVHVNQDVLGSRPKCVAAVKDALAEGKSVVVDNTNRDAATRKFYLDVAKVVGAETRCMLFTASVELAWHNNLYRAFNLPPSVAADEPKRSLVPYGAITSFRDQYEEPTTKEGFTEVQRVDFVFEGSEEERKRWSMWLQIDGK